MIPIITLFGLDFGVVVGGGAILTETVFNLDGVGLYAGEAIAQPRPAAADGGHDVRRLLHRAVQHASSTSSTRSSIRGSGSERRRHEPDATNPARASRRPARQLRHRGRRASQAVDGVSFELAAGEVLAIVGESGCGKSVTAQTLIGPDPRAQRARSPARSSIDGRGAHRARRRGSCATSAASEIAMVFQDPMTSLNPVYRVGDQIVEMIRAHRRRLQEGGRETRASSCCARSASPIPSGASTSTRTSSPAGCASG